MCLYMFILHALNTDDSRQDFKFNTLIPSLDFLHLREKNVFRLRKYLTKIMKDKVLLEASIFCLPSECNTF